jgi:hypothetical protein
MCGQPAGIGSKDAADDRPLEPTPANRYRLKMTSGGGLILNK